jgi:hypothetical protein
LYFDFPARYEVVVLDRIGGGHEYIGRAYGFPAGGALDPQQELADGPILGVIPAEGDPWVGVFYGGGYGAPPAATSRVVGWPDEVSLCVVYTGNAVVVRSDSPEVNLELDVFPVCDVLAVPEHNMVVFADFTTLYAYNAKGFAWGTDRLVWDELKILGVEGDAVRLSGFDAPANAYPEFTVDLRTGKATDRPY